jgi:hypothetical protein
MEENYIAATQMAHLEHLFDMEIERNLRGNPVDYNS